MTQPAPEPDYDAQQAALARQNQATLVEQATAWQASAHANLQRAIALHVEVAARDEEIATLTAQVAELEAQVAHLSDLLNPTDPFRDE